MQITSSTASGMVSTAYGMTGNSSTTASTSTTKGETKETESIWRRMAAKYNVRDITPEETAEMSLALYEVGAISFTDHALLSFDPDHNQLPGGSGYLTEADINGRRDMISEYEARIELARKMGDDSRSLANMEKILDYLSTLDAARGKPINIVT